MASYSGEMGVTASGAPQLENKQCHRSEDQLEPGKLSLVGFDWLSLRSRWREREVSRANGLSRLANQNAS